MQHEGISLRMSLYLLGGIIARVAVLILKVPGDIDMKASLIALYTLSAVSSAAFAYQNNPQGAETNTMGTRGAQFVMRDDPGVDPPKAAVMDDPGVDPPKTSMMDDPGVDPPKASMMMDDPGVDPPKASMMMDDPGVDPPKTSMMDDPGVDPPKTSMMDDPGVDPPKTSMMAASGLSTSHRH
jgi:hypothetical protein